MKNSTPFFAEFHLQSLRRPARSLQQKISDERDWLARRTFRQIGELCGKFIPSKLLEPSAEGDFSRNRIYSKTNVFWALFSQVLSPDGGCKEVVKKIQSYSSERGLEIPSSSTASYCAARNKLPQEMLDEVIGKTAKYLDRMSNMYSFHNRRVVVVDGTGFSMPDTEANQQEWPQSANQNPGCGFPSGRICACFCLDSGGLLSHRIGNKKSHELPLLRDQHEIFKTNDIFLGDKAFCSYYDIAKFQEMGVDSVVPLARRKPVTGASCVKKISRNDLIIRWKRPYFQKGKSSFSREEWEQLPNELLLRQVKVTVAVKGFRVEEFYIVTTLLDDALYTEKEIADLYYRRWDVELFFRDLKTTMRMDILRCKTPKMIRKEIQMFFIVYNCIRCLMCEAATEAGVPVRQISFKGALQAIRNWEPLFNPSQTSPRDRKRMVAEFYETVGQTLIDERPGRSEPRCVKRRPKPFQIMTASREKMKETPHRGKRTAKGRLN
jgi:hypothetical protein